MSQDSGTDKEVTLQGVLDEMTQMQAMADMAFNQVAEQFPLEVACGSGCDDCCHAVFDLTPAEAFVIALAFRKLPRTERREVLRHAEKAASAFDKIAADALAKPLEERLEVFSLARVACPLLKEGRCMLYAVRPITCRMYGIPVASGDHGHACPRSRFGKGEAYPTVDWDMVQERLAPISEMACEMVPQLGPQRRDLARALMWAQAQALTLEALEA